MRNCIICHSQSIVSGKQIRQELIFNVYASFGDNNIPGILQQIGQLALKNKRAYLRGDVIGPNGKMFDNSDLGALKAAYIEGRAV